MGSTGEPFKTSLFVFVFVFVVVFLYLYLLLHLDLDPLLDKVFSRFMLPASYILRTGREVQRSVKAMGQALKKRL